MRVLVPAKDLTRTTTAITTATTIENTRQPPASPPSPAVAAPADEDEDEEDEDNDFLGRLFGSESANQKIVSKIIPFSGQKPPPHQSPQAGGTSSPTQAQLQQPSPLQQDATVQSEAPTASAPIAPANSLFSNPNRFQDVIEQRNEKVRREQEAIALEQQERHKKSRLAEPASTSPSLGGSVAAAAPSSSAGPTTMPVDEANTSINNMRGPSPTLVGQQQQKYRFPHQQVAQGLLESLTVPIPADFVGLPMDLHSHNPKSTTPEKDTARDEKEEEYEILKGILRNFTRHASSVLARDGLVLLRKVDEGGAIFPDKLLTLLRQNATLVQKEVIERLNEVGKIWNTNQVQQKEQDIDSSSRKEEEVDSDRDASFCYHEVASRCLGRLDIRHGMDKPPFCIPQVLQNPWLMPLIQSILGDSAKLVYCGLILSFPGSLDQPWHQDGHPLFPEQLLEKDGDKLTDLPPYALNVFVPLAPIDSSQGPTEFWVGSHKESSWKMVQDTLSSSTMTSTTGVDFPNLRDTDEPTGMVGPTLSQGDVLIYDYRTCHRGTKNVSASTIRPMLYLMYARPWFAEHVNFGQQRLFPPN